MQTTPISALFDAPASSSDSNSLGGPQSVPQGPAPHSAVAAEWGAWLSEPYQPERPPEVRWTEYKKVHRNGRFVVCERPMPNGMTQLSIVGRHGQRPTWKEAQAIKNELAGADATALEVYPPQAEVIDSADTYHLWVLPPGVQLSFSLSDAREAGQEWTHPGRLPPGIRTIP
ncbi:DUF7694 domain-containing protein [Acidimangrovimonas pyrenivorans]